MVSVLDSGAERPGFKLQPRRCRVTVLGKLLTPIVLLFTKQQNGSSPLKGCRGNCSLPLGLWLTSPAGWLPGIGISSRTLRLVIECGLLLPFFYFWATVWLIMFNMGHVCTSQCTMFGGGSLYSTRGTSQMFRIITSHTTQKPGSVDMTAHNDLLAPQSTAFHMQVPTVQP